MDIVLGKLMVMAGILFYAFLILLISFGILALLAEILVKVIAQCYVDYKDKTKRCIRYDHDL